MAYIKINLNNYKEVVNNVNKYEENILEKKEKINNIASGLSITWSGNDHTNFINKWSEMFDKNGTFTAATNSVKSYGSLVEEILSKYKSAQDKSVELSFKINGNLW